MPTWVRKGKSGWLLCCFMASQWGRFYVSFLVPHGFFIWWSHDCDHDSFNNQIMLLRQDWIVGMTSTTKCSS